MHVHITDFCLINGIDNTLTKYTHEGLNEKKKSPYIHFKLCHCLHFLNLRQTFHENHYSKLKTDSQSCLPNWYNPPVSENFNPPTLKYVNHNIFIVRIMHQF